MFFKQLISRWIHPMLGSRPQVPFSPHLTSINPPALRHSDSLMQTLLRWIPGESDAWGAGTSARSPRQQASLAAVRKEFEAALDDIHSDDIDELLKRVRKSRSLRDLWHLRGAVFNVMARAHTQAEAEHRMARLNQRFPGYRQTTPRQRLAEKMSEQLNQHLSARPAEQHAGKTWH